MRKTLLLNLLFGASLLMGLAACGLLGDSKVENHVNSKLGLEESRGSLTGGSGLLSMGGDKNSGPAIGVNSFLWRATLDTLSFMPLASADPFGGVIITDWYEDPKTKGERYKVTVLILGKELRADGVKVNLFKQKADAKGQWHDVEVDKDVPGKLEDSILTRAREMRLAQSK